jgi:hypothetical protein
LRAAFSREEQSDVAGSNLAPCAKPPVTVTAYGIAVTRDCFVSLLRRFAPRNDDFL